MSHGWRLLILFYCTFHVLAILSYNLPLTPSFHKVQRVFAPYVELLAQFQGYQMFIHRDYWKKLKITMMAENEREAREFDPTLPQFTPATPANVRVQKLFQAWSGGSADKLDYAEHYARRACKRIRQRRAFVPRRIWLKMSGETISSFEEVERGAPVFKKTEYFRGPYPCH